MEIFYFEINISILNSEMCVYILFQIYHSTDVVSNHCKNNALPNVYQFHDSLLKLFAMKIIIK